MLKKALATAFLTCIVVASHAADTAAKSASPPKIDPTRTAPFSEGIMVGDTFYVSGHIGVDPATDQVPTNAETEARMVMDAIQRALEKAGLKTDDLVSVTVYCSDLDLYDKFNTVYRNYFHGRFPTRAFIGVNKLLIGAHFEVAGIAVREPEVRKP